ncbi:unnamed protein product [Symbiodinium pilosum]|uniref:Uncharacterized protein n=1 Tax=Symbiodinium pilosum TaxID=2952 RepID=A0A812SGE2_SYMPI|nr:unnamed protein product [Symbiodinium pilosum]
MPLSAEVERQVAALIEGSKNGEFLVRNVQEIFSILRRNSLLTTMRIPPMAVGVHPQNRDGAALVTQDVHELLESIVQVGFTPSRVNAIGIEVASEGEREFNKQLVMSAGSQLGQMDSEALKALSLSGSHTNWALRLVASGSPHASDIISVNGHVSFELVEKRDKCLADHAREGLTWQIIASEVGRRFPELLQMVQASCNATLQKTESELQLLRRVCSLLSKVADGKPDYKLIKKQALASKPPCGDSLAGIYAFALKPHVSMFSGGATAWMVTETESFVRANGYPRTLGPAFWDELAADAKFSDQVPCLRHAILKLACSGQVITPANLKKVFGKDGFCKAQSADAVIRKLRDVLSENGLDIMADPRLLNLMGVTEINIARMVLGMASPAQEKPYESVEAVGHDCVLLLNAILGSTMSSPWLSYAQKTDEGPAGSAASSSGIGERLRELNPDGSLKDPSILLLDMGFTPGAYCKRKTEKVAMECQVQSVEGKTVQLKELKSGGLLKIGTEDFMAGQWILFKPKAGPECLEDLTGMGPHDSEEFKLALMIADIHQEVHGLVKSCDSHKMLSKLAIQIKPAKGIIAKAAFPKGKLVLEDLANMEVFLSGNKASKVRIPLYRNTKKIAIDDHLQISKVKNVASQIAAEEPPAKRPKK